MSGAPPDTKSRYATRSVAAEFNTVQEIQPQDVAPMVAALTKMFHTDKTTSRAWRVQQLRNFMRMISECREELCEALKKDLHKSKFEAYATELGLVLHECQYALTNLDTWMTPTKAGNSPLNIPSWSTTQHDPLGVVLILGSWNYPMQLSLAPIVGAIAGGNCVILKPGSYAVNSSNCLARIIPRYMDQDCIKVVEGNRHVTTALLAERYDKIFFTGSGFVGRIVSRAAAEHMTPCVLELGGKSPCIIDKTADLVHSVDRLAWATFLNGGQTCVRPDFVMVHEDVADQFYKQIQSTIIKYYSENPQSSEWFGRCINADAYKRLSQLVEENKDYIVTGGQTDAKDNYVCPTVFDFGTNMTAFEKSGLMLDEIFGPLLPCIRYKETNDVIEFVRRLPTGKPLALYAFSKDSQFIDTIKNRTTSGGLNINDCLMHLANPELPFGGVGSSGMGSYHGKYSFDCFTHEKAVLEKSQALDEFFLVKPLLHCRFPPYTPWKQGVIKVFSLYFIEKIVNSPIPLVRMLLKLLAAYLAMRICGFQIVRS